MIGGIERLIGFNVVHHPITIDSPKHRRQREIIKECFIEISEWFSDVCTKDRYATSGHEVLVEHTLTDTNAEVTWVT